ncbi:MAG: hypothetical protein HOK71_21935 [Planctomycetaceae bacterium]|jgi:hypothetical protein|nr:hypothetical protein [Planctomycetaceae bacterium]MBT6487318.1 hypothetical protein [Planctomycetaceae bacterium]
MKRAPGMLQAICIIAISMGALGFFSAVGGIAGPMVGESFQNMTMQMVPTNSPQARKQFQKQVQQQKQLQHDINAVMKKWATVTYALAAVQLVLVGCLIVGGVKAFRLQPSGHRLLVMAFLIAIAFELMQLIPTINMQMETAEITEQFMADAMKSSSAGKPMPPSFSRMMKFFMKIGTFLGFAISMGWVLMKLGFYGYGTHFLRKPRTRGLFEPATEIDWDDDAPDAGEQTVPEDDPDDAPEDEPTD